MPPASDEHTVESTAVTERRPDRVHGQLRSRSLDGFTLFEILIAMMMLSFVFTTLFVSFRQLLGDAQAVTRKNALTEMTATALHHVVADLDAAFILLPPFYSPPGIHDTKAPPYRFTGTTTPIDGSAFADIRFVSGRHIDGQGAGGEGFAAIRYYVAPDGNGALRLKRQDRLVAFGAMTSLAPWPDPIVCEHVKRFEITYFDDDDNAHDEWDSEAESFGYATPTAIRIVLGVARPDGEAMTLTTTVYLTAIRMAPGASDQ
ncbi:MAG: hypothetical protein ABIL58_11310 [Pseudomonadota bacterium]